MSLDEGVVQVCKQEILALPLSDFAQLMAGREIVVLLPRDPETVVERLLERGRSSVRYASRTRA